MVTLPMCISLVRSIPSKRHNNQLLLYPKPILLFSHQNILLDDYNIRDKSMKSRGYFIPLSCLVTIPTTIGKDYGVIDDQMAGDMATHI